MSNTLTLYENWPSADSPIDQIADTYQRLEGLAQAIKEARAALEQVMIEKVREHGPFVIGDKKAFLCKKKKVKCISPGKTLDALYVHTDGDVEKVVGCLSANAWKPGAIKSLLEEAAAHDGAFDELFKTTIEDGLEFTLIDTKFLK